MYSNMSRFQRSSLFRLRVLRHFVSAALLLTMCSPVRVLNPSQHPSNQFTASFCCGPEVFCFLKKICSPNAAICWANGSPLMRWCAVIPSPPTWNVVRVHAACRTNHFRIELSRLIVAPICRSLKSLIARICPWMVWFLLARCRCLRLGVVHVRFLLGMCVCLLCD